ncbi:hypothetical protein BJ165DRAFT_486772 [Panaeolus papilionaceus]|nr:hypothetical protein BJ165DRAFT_486772 [Panaeolus papilionaceus]
MQIRAVIAVLIAAAPFAAATFPKGNLNNCPSNEFRFGSWCLPKGGPPKEQTPPPPKGSNCPPTQWYWNKGKGCCTPRNQPPANPPPPQCPKDWQWNAVTNKCDPCPTPPTKPPPTPSNKPGEHSPPKSGYPGYPGHPGPVKPPGQFRPYGHNKRANTKSRVSLCPTGLDACPISQLVNDYECLDTAVELESCGGCASLGQGQDCTQIEGAWNVGCEQGTCVVLTCAGGFSLSADRKTCVPL